MTTPDRSEAPRPSERTGQPDPRKDPHVTYDEGQTMLETLAKFLAEKKSGKTASPQAPSAPQEPQRS